MGLEEVVPNAKPIEPFTVEEALRWVAKYLDLADELTNLVMDDDRGKELNSDEVQQDLLHMAEWLEGHPKISAEIWAYVQAER